MNAPSLPHEAVTLLVLMLSSVADRLAAVLPGRLRAARSPRRFSTASAGGTSIVPRLSPSGGVAWPKLLYPQQTTVPSVLTTQVCEEPTLTCTTLANPGGTSAPPASSVPQQTTVRSDLTAHVGPPALICVTD